MYSGENIQGVAGQLFAKEIRHIAHGSKQPP